jgi:hypothetical protein
VQDIAGKHGCALSVKNKDVAIIYVLKCSRRRYWFYFCLRPIYRLALGSGKRSMKVELNNSDPNMDKSKREGPYFLLIAPLEEPMNSQDQQYFQKHERQSHEFELNHRLMRCF